MAEQEKINLVEQTGGEKLGQGGFGCVITPAISCRKTTLPKNAVSKITYVMPGYEMDYHAELKLLNRIHQLDPQQKYFVSLIDECPLDTRNISTRNPKDVVEVSYEDDELETFRVKPSEPKYISRMSSKDISKNYCLVDDYLEPRNQIQEFGGYSLYNITPDRFGVLYNSIRRDYKFVIKNLLIGLQLLHNNRIAHRDIKEDNILGLIVNSYRTTTAHRNHSHKLNNKQNDAKHKTSKKHNKNISKQKISKPLVRYIDFGLSNQINPDLDEGGIANFHWSGTDGYIPIDFVLLYYMEDYVRTYGAGVLRNASNKQRILKKTKARYEKAYKMFYDDIHVEQSLMEMPKSIHKKTKYILSSGVYEFLDFNQLSKIYDKLVDSLINRTFYKLMKTDLVGFVYKADIFALGITLGFMRRHFRLYNDSKLTDLISKMIKLNPIARPSIKDCLAHPFIQN